jgi:hypothetical protein
MQRNLSTAVVARMYRCSCRLCIVYRSCAMQSRGCLTGTLLRGLCVISRVFEHRQARCSVGRSLVPRLPRLRSHRTQQ